MDCKKCENKIYGKLPTGRTCQSCLKKLVKKVVENKKRIEVINMEFKKQEILDVLNNLEVIEQNGGESSYILVSNNKENHDKLNAVGIESETINKYGDEETFCILALAFSEGYANEMHYSKLVNV